jgi:hypothetical protein
MRSGIETRRRSLAKALSWRIVAAIITTLVVLAMTGRLEFAAKIGLIDTPSSSSSISSTSAPEQDRLGRLRAGYVV